MFRFVEFLLLRSVWHVDSNITDYFQLFLKILINSDFRNFFQLQFQFINTFNVAWSDIFSHKMWRKQRSENLNWFFFLVFIWYLMGFYNVYKCPADEACISFFITFSFFACSAKEWKKEDILRQKTDFRGLQQIWLFPVVPAVKRRRCRAVLYSAFSAHDWSWTTCDGNYGEACSLRGCSLKFIRNYSGAT